MASELIFHVFLLFLIGFASYSLISTISPVDSVLFLVSAFLSSAAYLLLIEAEFLALIFLVIYVGAIAVLFLFIIMMLDIKLHKNERGSYGFLSFILCFIFFVELSMISVDVFKKFEIRKYNSQWHLLIDNVTNIDSIGQCLYTDFINTFLLSGLVLLVSMLGAIILSANFFSYRKNEIISKQTGRVPSVVIVS